MVDFCMNLKKAQLKASHLHLAINQLITIAKSITPNRRALAITFSPKNQTAAAQEATTTVPDLASKTTSPPSQARI
jgi:hypothetical protein